MDLADFQRLALQNPEAAHSIAFAAKQQLPVGDQQANVIALLDRLLHPRQNQPVRRTG